MTATTTAVRPLRRTTSRGKYFGAETVTITVRRDASLIGERVTAIFYVDDCRKHGRVAGDVLIKHHKGHGMKDSYVLHSQTVVTGVLAEDDVDAHLDAYAAARLSH
jgi:hypothetical protein